jgi:3'-5' exoribonuclease
MDRIFIGDMQPGQRIDDQVFLVAQRDLRQSSNGSLYIHAILKDKSGDAPARMWQATEEIYRSIPEGGFVRLWGRSESYKGNLQFIIEAVRSAENQDVDLEDFLPRTEKNIDEMWDRTLEILRGIKDPHLIQLIKRFVTDEDLSERFKKSPAAITIHHAYIGGLLEHTLNLLELALLVIPRYPQVSLDVVIAGIFLHDIAKTHELSYETSFGYTDRGQLVGHLVEAVIWIEKAAAEVEAESGEPIPREILNVLEHLVLSHHGSYEYGSPKLPATPEAIAIHYLDNLDAKLNIYLSEIESDPDPDSAWTNYKRTLETKIYKKFTLSNRPAGESS